MPKSEMNKRPNGQMVEKTKNQKWTKESKVELTKRTNKKKSQKVE